MTISYATGCLERTAADGTRFAYYDVGSGTVPIILLHGLFGSPSNWQSIMQDLIVFSVRDRMALSGLVTADIFQRARKIERSG